MPTTQSDSFYKSIKFFGLTILLMFSGPGAIYEAFKNENHPLYLPVLILGFILSLAAMGLFLYSLRLMMHAIFGNKKNN
ncbi:MAG: DUF6095 family protein [Cellulophaga sp.]|uniref:DUF6095 family protein n=1 Tax=unclassified Cellulophaga TaxID=2634405 RepID=UPI000C2C8A18|nr:MULTISPECIES: DUF6095 family protein [unclassified Cellulophaga]MDO6490786.1 DUF6095 family protein [Cellulophaga sp. 2_MG-2023]MDO6494020.1 DUF6095 family protein [Cellulophaga sp. 3_MG-2023]PKB43967.1 hypothetical protein AX016_2178 [Cellulophaga sp. RHA19]